MATPVAGAGSLRVGISFRTLILLAVAGALLPATGLPRYWVTFMTGALILGVAGMSLVLTWSWGGMLSFGQAAFVGLGAYFGAWLYRPECTGLHRGGRAAAECVNIFPPWAYPVLGIVVAILLGCVISAVAFRARLSAFLFAILTLLASVVMAILANGLDVTNRQTGIFPIPSLSIPGPLDSTWSMFYIALGTFIGVALVLRFFIRSRFGLILAAIRDNELRAISVGYRTDFYRVLIFGAGAGVAALAGFLYAHHSGIVTPRLVGFELSANLVIWLVLGGRQYLAGAFVGYLLVQGSQVSFSADRPEIVAFVSALLFIALIIKAPQGLLGLSKPAGEWLTRSLRGLVATLQGWLRPQSRGRRSAGERSPRNSDKVGSSHDR